MFVVGKCKMYLSRRLRVGRMSTYTIGYLPKGLSTYLDLFKDMYEVATPRLGKYVSKYIMSPRHTK